MPERALVHQCPAGPDHHRSLATRVQRRTTEEGVGRANARRVCQAVDDRNEGGESNRRTLIGSATQSGGTSLLRLLRLKRWAKAREEAELRSIEELGDFDAWPYRNIAEVPNVALGKDQDQS